MSIFTLNEETSVPLYFPYASGRLYTSPLETSITAFNVVADTLYGIIFPVLSYLAIRFDIIGIEQTAVSDAFYRLGVYNDSNGIPGSLVFDAGEVNSNRATGFKAIIIDQTLLPGWYWLALNCSAAPQVRAIGQGNQPHWLGASSGTDTTIHPGVSAASTYGALPDPFPSSSLITTSVPRILIGVSEIVQYDLAPI